MTDSSEIYDIFSDMKHDVDQARVNHTSKYEDDVAWIEARAKNYGSLGAFISSSEYAEEYERIKASYQRYVAESYILHYQRNGAGAFYLHPMDEKVAESSDELSLVRSEISQKNLFDRQELVDIAEKHGVGIDVLDSISIEQFAKAACHKNIYVALNSAEHARQRESGVSKQLREAAGSLYEKTGIDVKPDLIAKGFSAACLYETPEEVADAVYQAGLDPVLAAEEISVCGAKYLEALIDHPQSPVGGADNSMAMDIVPILKKMRNGLSEDGRSLLLLNQFEQNKESAAPTEENQGESFVFEAGDQVESAGAIFEVVRPTGSGTYILKSDSNEFESSQGEELVPVAAKLAEPEKDVGLPDIDEGLQSYQDRWVENKKDQKINRLNHAEQAIRKIAPDNLPVGIDPVQWLLSLKRVTKPQKHVRAEYNLALKSLNADKENGWRHAKHEAKLLWQRHQPSEPKEENTDTQASHVHREPEVKAPVKNDVEPVEPSVGVSIRQALAESEAKLGRNAGAYPVAIQWDGQLREAMIYPGQIPPPSRQMKGYEKPLVIYTLKIGRVFEERGLMYEKFTLNGKNRLQKADSALIQQNSAMAQLFRDSGLDVPVMDVSQDDLFAQPETGVDKDFEDIIDSIALINSPPTFHEWSADPESITEAELIEFGNELDASIERLSNGSLKISIEGNIKRHNELNVVARGAQILMEPGGTAVISYYPNDQYAADYYAEEEVRGYNPDDKTFFVAMARAAEALGMNDTIDVHEIRNIAIALRGGDSSAFDKTDWSEIADQMLAETGHDPLSIADWTPTAKLRAAHRVVNGKPLPSDALPLPGTIPAKPLENEQFKPRPVESAYEVELPGGAANLQINEDQFKQVTDDFDDLFADAPERDVIQSRVGPVISQKEAREIISSWENEIERQANEPKSRSANAEKTILSFYDHSGEWSSPWLEAGYNVIRFDIQDGQDVFDFSADYFEELIDEQGIQDVYGILIATPCTEFTISGNQWWDVKDMDGRTELAKAMVYQALKAVEFFRPKIWALENPAGRIEKLTNLPKARLSFQPNHFGEAYTKKTLIWGRFNSDLPTAHTEPSEGSKMHTKFGGKSLATKNGRSETPRGFSLAMFMANNYEGLSPRRRIEVDFPHVSGAGAGAIDAGLSEPSVREIIRSFDVEERDEVITALALATDAVSRGVEIAQIDAAVNKLEYSNRNQFLADIKNIAQKQPSPFKVESTGYIPGSAKERWGKYRDDISAEYDFADEPLSKIFPEPKCDALVQGGADKLAVAMIAVFRSEIPRKPTVRGIKEWAEKVKYYRDFTLKVLDGETSIWDELENRFKQFLELKPPKEREDLKKERSLRTLASVYLKVKLVNSECEPANYNKVAKSIRLDVDVNFNDAGDMTPVYKFGALKGKYFDPQSTAYCNSLDQLAEHFHANVEPSITTAKKTKTDLDERIFRDIDIFQTRGEADQFVGYQPKGLPLSDLITIEVLPAGMSRKEKVEWLESNKQRLVDDIKSRREFTYMVEGSSVREGLPDWREGRDVSPEEVKTFFGFKEVRFGTSILKAQSEAQKKLNEAYDAFRDMCFVLDLPPRAASLDGELAFAFAERGRGTAKSGISTAAQFTEENNIINLSRRNGAGNVAHEWFHAADAYFGKTSGNSMTETAGTFTGFKLDSAAGIIGVDTSVREEVINAFIEIRKSISGNAYHNASEEMDIVYGRKQRYWSAGYEKAARAFEAFLVDRFSENGMRNDFLVSVSSDRDDPEMKAIVPGRQAMESLGIRAAFENLFSNLKLESQPDGRHILYKLSDPTFDVAGAWVQSIRANPVLSGYEHDDSLNLVEIASNAGLAAAVDELASAETYRIETGSGSVAVIVDDVAWCDPADCVTNADLKLVQSLTINLCNNRGIEFTCRPSAPIHEVVTTTESMIDSAMKYGETNHLLPSEQQLAAVADDGGRAQPIAGGWSNDASKDFKALVESSANTVSSLLPEVSGVRWSGNEFSPISYTGSTMSDAAELSRMLNGEVTVEQWVAGRPFSPLERAIMDVSTIKRAVAVLQTDPGRRETLLAEALAASSKILAGKIDPQANQTELLERHHQNVTQWVAEVEESTGVMIKTVMTAGDLPSRIQKFASDTSVAGIYDMKSGVPFVISDRIRNRKHCIKSALHEGLGHAGVIQFIQRNAELGGNHLEDVLDKVYRDIGKRKILSETRGYRFDLNKASGRREAVLEYIAHLAETQVDNQSVGEVLSETAEFVGEVHEDIAWTRSDILNLIEAARVFHVKESVIAAGAAFTDARHDQESKRKAELERISEVAGGRLKRLLREPVSGVRFLPDRGMFNYLGLGDPGELHGHVSYFTVAGAVPDDQLLRLDLPMHQQSSVIQNVLDSAGLYAAREDRRYRSGIEALNRVIESGGAMPEVDFDPSGLKAYEDGLATGYEFLATLQAAFEHDPKMRALAGDAIQSGQVNAVQYLNRVGISGAGISHGSDYELMLFSPGLVAKDIPGVGPNIIPRYTSEFIQRAVNTFNEIRYCQPEASAEKPLLPETKITADSGQPRIVYHGTHSVIEGDFNVSQAGTVGAGVYFAGTKEDALGHGDSVVEAYLDVQNPWEISLAYDTELAEAHDFESPSVDAVLSLPGGRVLLDEAKQSPFGHYGPKLTQKLIELGYDGIVGTYEDGSEEIVAFHPDQVHTLHQSGLNLIDLPENLAKRAYHGTPHDVNQFSIDNIGSGEGNNSYGWGLYFAENMETARWYRDILSVAHALDIPDQRPVGQTAGAVELEMAAEFNTRFKELLEAYSAGLANSTPELTNYYAVFNMINHIDDLDTEYYKHNQEDIEGNIAGARDILKADHPEWDDVQIDEQLERDGVLKIRTPHQRAYSEALSVTAKYGRGNLYEVELPEEDELLDYDARLSDMGRDIRQKLLSVAGGALFNEVIQNLHIENPTGESLYRTLESDLGSRKAASLALEAAGIPGMKYLDAGSRNGSGSTRNYVVWDDSVIQMVTGRATTPAQGVSDIGISTFEYKTRDDSRNVDEEKNAAEAEEKARKTVYDIQIGGSFLGNAMTADFVDRSATNLIGQSIENYQDLAVLSQVYRNPFFETLRYILVKDDRIVLTTGVSSRMPSSSAAYPEKQGPEFLANLMRESGADGYYLVHNHPSGNPNPSAGDKYITSEIAAAVDGFLGHVIVNHYTYSVIKKNQRLNVGRLLPRKVALNTETSWSRQHTQEHELLGRSIRSPEDAAEIAADFERAERVVIACCGGPGTAVKAVVEYTPEFMSNLSYRSAVKEMRNLKMVTASEYLFVISHPETYEMNAVMERAFRFGFFRDVLSKRGESLALTGLDTRVVPEPRGIQVDTFREIEPLEPTEQQPFKMAFIQRDPLEPEQQMDLFAAVSDSLLPEQLASRVYHSAVSEFSEFDSSKLTDDVATKAYGWGHYFTSSEDLASYYRGEFAAKGKEAVINELNNEFPNRAELLSPLVESVASNLGQPVAYTIAGFIAGSDGDDKRWMIQNAAEVGQFLKQAKRKIAGITYQVDLDETRAAGFLDLNKNLASQPGVVREFIQQNKADLRIGFWQTRRLTGADLYKKLTATEGSEKAASLKLLAAGVAGMQYLSGKTDASSQTQNYVVFDDDAVRIIDRLQAIREREERLQNKTIDIQNNLNELNGRSFRAAALGYSPKIFYQDAEGFLTDFRPQNGEPFFIKVGRTEFADSEDEYRQIQGNADHRERLKSAGVNFISYLGEDRQLITPLADGLVSSALNSFPLNVADVLLKKDAITPEDATNAGYDGSTAWYYSSDSLLSSALPQAKDGPLGTGVYLSNSPVAAVDMLVGQDTGPGIPLNNIQLSLGVSAAEADKLSARHDIEAVECYTNTAPSLKLSEGGFTFNDEPVSLAGPEVRQIMSGLLGDKSKAISVITDLQDIFSGESPLVHVAGALDLLERNDAKEFVAKLALKLGARFVDFNLQVAGTDQEQQHRLALFSGSDILSSKSNIVGNGVPVPEALTSSPVPKNVLPAGFRHKFGDSVVCDPLGKPKLVYRGEHGASEELVHSRRPSISFGSANAANVYAVQPNDRADIANAPRVTPAYLSIQRPLVVEPGDPFIDLQQLQAALGVDDAGLLEIADKFSDYIEVTDNYQETLEDLELPDTASLAMVYQADREAFKGLYFETYAALDDADIVARLKERGFDGAIHCGSGETALDVEYRVFSVDQVIPAISHPEVKSYPGAYMDGHSAELSSVLVNVYPDIKARGDAFYSDAWEVEVAGPISQLTDLQESYGTAGYQLKVVEVLGADNPYSVERLLRELQSTDMADVLKLPKATAMALDSVNWLSQDDGAVISLSDAATGMEQLQSRFLFAGENAKNAPLETLATAKQFPGRWSETGWAKGEDGFWRFEVDDSKADLTVEATTFIENAINSENTDDQKFESLLGHVLAHYDLYRQYPGIADVYVSFRPKPDGSNIGGRASAYEKHGPRMSMIEIYIDQDSSLQSVLSIILHETQHIIQRAEGFAKGSAAGPIEKLKEQIEYMDDLVEGSYGYEKEQKVTEELSRLNTLSEWAQLEKYQKNDNITRQASNIYSSTRYQTMKRQLWDEIGLPPSRRNIGRHRDWLHQACWRMQLEVASEYANKHGHTSPRQMIAEMVAEGGPNALKNAVARTSRKFYNSPGYRALAYRYKSTAKKLDFIADQFWSDQDQRDDAYHRSAGEVEARNVQKRHEMSTEDKKATAPYLTEDVERHKQITVAEPVYQIEQIEGRPVKNKLLELMVQGRPGLEAQYVDSAEDLPAAALRDCEKMNAMEPAGAMVDDKIYIVGSENSQVVAEAVLHEMSHKGVKAIFGKTLERTYTRFYLGIGGEAGLKDQAEKAGIEMDHYHEAARKMVARGSMTETAKVEMLVDEFIAHAVQKRATERLAAKAKRLTKEFIGGVRNACRKVGLINTSKLTDSDLAYTLKSIHRTALGKETGAPVVITNETPAEKMIQYESFLSAIGVIGNVSKSLAIEIAAGTNAGKMPVTNAIDSLLRENIPVSIEGVMAAVDTLYQPAAGDEGATYTFEIIREKVNSELLSGNHEELSDVLYGLEKLLESSKYDLSYESLMTIAPEPAAESELDGPGI